jgi:hypothetical protein
MIDPKKQYKTRDGREVRIYAVDGEGQYPIHGAIREPCGWVSAKWTRDGSWVSHKTTTDLIEVKPRIRREVWVNVYKNPNIGDILFLSKEEADNCRLYDRIACVKMTIDCEEGEGL